MDELYSLDDVMACLKLSRSTVIKLIRQKKLKASKIGKCYRIKKSDLQEFLQSSDCQE